MTFKALLIWSQKCLECQGIIDLESEISQKVEQEFSVIMAKQAEKKIFNAKNNMSHLFNNRSSKCY